MLIVVVLKSDCDVSLHSCSRRKTGGGTNSHCVTIVFILYSYCTPIGGGGRETELLLHAYCIHISLNNVVVLGENRGDKESNRVRMTTTEGGG